MSTTSDRVVAMPRFDTQGAFPIAAFACECMIWAIAPIIGGVGRCGQCGKRPRRIPAWQDLPED